eukprot:7888186-Alexandrium_andersonii.AAC.1
MGVPAAPSQAAYAGVRRQGPWGALQGGPGERDGADGDPIAGTTAAPACGGGGRCKGPRQRAAATARCNCKWTARRG